MRKNVVFLLDPTKPWGSNLLRGEQLCKIASWSLHDTALKFEIKTLSADVNDAVIFCVKSAVASLSSEAIFSLKAKGNVLCADVLDLDPRSTDLSLYDFLVSSSILQHENFKLQHAGKPVYNVTHHVDLRIPEVECRKDAFSAVYIGDVNNAFAVKNVVTLLAIIQSNVIDTRWITEIPRHNLHYCVRESKPWDGFKPFTKGFIAAHAGAVVLVSKNDQEAARQLGPGYPFFCEHDLESVRAMLSLAKLHFGGQIWRQAERQMSVLRERSSPKEIVAEIKALLDAAKVS